MLICVVAHSGLAASKIAIREQSNSQKRDDGDLVGNVVIGNDFKWCLYKVNRTW